MALVLTANNAQASNSAVCVILFGMAVVLLSARANPTCAVGGRFLCFHRKRPESDQGFRVGEGLIWACSADLGYFLWHCVWF